MNFNQRSLKYIISILFIILIITTFGTISLIVFSNWRASVNRYINKIEQHTNQGIITKIEALIGTSTYINETNRRLIAENIVDMHHDREREQFFANILLTNNKEIYSFSYGTENGEYYGARRNQKNEIELIKENAQTGGHSWYYAMNKDGTAGRFIQDLGEFDPRTREWYKIAKDKHRPVFSPIYKHFVKDDMAISAAYPIYRKDGTLAGVLGTHIILTDINRYLKKLVADKHAIAYIIEKSSGNLVANSETMPNFYSSVKNQITRITLYQTGNQSVSVGYRSFMRDAGHNHVIRTRYGRLRIRVTEYRKLGLDWLIITGIPESRFTADIDRNFLIVVLLSLVTIFIAVLIYLRSTGIILRPIYTLIDITEKFSRGDFSQRTTVNGNDEIGKLSKAFNQMADQLNTLINNLEAKVRERTLELERTNDSLRKSEENIRLLLDSTAEAIFGIDTQGICTFCNPSCLKMLGYKEKKDLIGKKMHDLIHNRQLNERPIAIEDCQIFQALTQGESAHSTDQVFWRADGSCFPVEYFSFPQFYNGQVVGSVITFFDITERKKSEEEIMDLSYRDQLTGLYNRRFFEEALKRNDVEKNYPLTIVFADMNGLKLINDSFGHTMGDRLLKKVAEVLLRGCRSEDTLARLGGDEFVILLPKTGSTEAEQIVKRIKKIAATEAIDSIEVSISCGYGSKINPEESIQEVLKKAEDRMYENKLFESPGMKARMVQVILGTLYAKDPQEKEHSQSVSDWCQQTGKVLGLSGQEIEVLKWAGLYHDIGKVVIEDKIWKNAETLNKDDWKEIKRHSEIGYRILSTVNDMSELAEYVLAHHERWDGQGYPKGLRGENIPLQSRIIAVTEAYDFMTNERIYKNALSQSEAIEELYKNAGKQFDPTIVEVFVEKILKAKDGRIL